MSRPASIVRPIVLLVIAAVAVASGVQFAITFNGPPPFAAPARIADIAAALRAGATPAGEPGRRVRISDGADDGLANGIELPERDAQVAQALGVPAEQVRGRYQFPRGPGRGPEIFGEFAIVWEAPDGPRTARSTPRPWLTSWHRITLVSTLAVLIALGLAAWAIARAISHPIRRLAVAAGEARLGMRKPIPHEGPREVRELATALEAMQARILEQAEGRTAMLAAIAHDLGTPLTRIAYRIEKLPEAERERAEADVREMREMLGEVLRFARDGSSVERARVELGSLIESLADDLSAGGMGVSAEPGPRAVVAGDPQALRRLFANLAENAVRYGKEARLGWAVAGGRVEVTIDDDGPGFGPDPAALFAPFVRGEGSRNRATGGTGLGLAIVRGIAEAHGGEVFLENRAGGGGRARVRLPVE